MSKTIPATREEFKEKILRKLGKPVIQINVSDDQVEDAIETTLEKYYMYHYDGSLKTYFKHQITQQDKTNGYFEMPDGCLGVVNIFNIGGALSTGAGMFNLEYQIVANDLYSLTSTSLVPYYSVMTQLELIRQVLVGEQPIRYNQRDNKLYIDMNMDRITNGMYIIVECYIKNDPEVNPLVWKDIWLEKYATELVKLTWGSNLQKFSGIQLPGGITYNGDKIYNDAKAELSKLDEDLINNYQMITDFNLMY